MSKIDEATAAKIARLSRLEISGEELTRRAASLNGLISWIEQLAEVNTDGIEPLRNVADIELTLREDEVTDGGDSDGILANAPEATQGFFVVPKVVE